MNILAKLRELEDADWKEVERSGEMLPSERGLRVGKYGRTGYIVGLLRAIEREHPGSISGLKWPEGFRSVEDLIEEDKKP